MSVIIVRVFVTKFTFYRSSVKNSLVSKKYGQFLALGTFSLWSRGHDNTLLVIVVAWMFGARQQTNAVRKFLKQLCEWRFLPVGQDMLTLPQAHGVITDLQWSIQIIFTNILSSESVSSVIETDWFYLFYHKLTTVVQEPSSTRVHCRVYNTLW